MSAIALPVLQYFPPVELQEACPRIGRQAAGAILGYLRSVAYEDDLPHITKPKDVDDDEWEIRLAGYITALAQYRRAVGVVGDEIREGRVPSDEQRRAEIMAQDDLAVARAALLDLAPFLPAGPSRRSDRGD